MDFDDNILYRIDNEVELKKSINALACFNDRETGETLSKLIAFFVLSKSEKSSVTFLQLARSNEDVDLLESDVYQHAFISDNPEERDDKIEKNKVTIRSFFLKSDNFIEDILIQSKEQKSNFVLAGINNLNLTPEIYQKYIKLKLDPTNTDKYIYEQFDREEATILRDLSTLFEINPVATGLFINRGLKEMKNIFIPILSLSDLQVLPLIYVRLSRKENVRLMIWDAIGAIQNFQKIQKLYQSFKKADERVELWDINKKIDSEFIKQQDLILIGLEGWRKLLTTPLDWVSLLPSVLIFKDK